LSKVAGAVNVRVDEAAVRADVAGDDAVHPGEGVPE
jgi:hypothetical protein